MLKIIDYQERIAEDGRSFFALVAQGGIEMIRSKQTNQYYATAKKVSIPCTFDGETCRAIIGDEIEGRIVKQECESYDYTIKATGEVIELDYRYVYQSENVVEEHLSSKGIVADSNTFSENGVLTH